MWVSAMLPPDTAHQPNTSLAPRDQESSAATTLASGRDERPALSGQRVGAYELLERIGRGGLGDVYRARHGATGEVVALKLLRGGGDADPAEVRSFRREIEAARRLSHPGILPILDDGL